MKKYISYTRFFLLFILSIYLYACGSAKRFVAPKSLVYLGQYESEKQMAALYDSANAPLLLYKNSIIYLMHADCVADAFGGDANDRNSAGDANKRKRTGDNNNRNANGDANNRNNGGGSGERKGRGKNNNRNKNGDANDRNAAGGANNRNVQGGANDRQANGDAQTFTCAVSKGKLILGLKNITKKDPVRIYYNHLFYDRKYFSITQ